jgi:hypothetical protein
MHGLIIYFRTFLSLLTVNKEASHMILFFYLLPVTTLEVVDGFSWNLIRISVDYR